MFYEKTYFGFSDSDNGLPLFLQQAVQEAEGDGKSTVTILCVTSPETEALKVAADVFMERNPDIRIAFNEQGRLGYFTNVTTQLVGGTTEFDLVQDNTTYMTELAAAGVLEPWDDYLNDPELTDLAAYDLDDLPIKLTYEGKIYCIPTDLSSQLYYYRTDMMNQPAETWEELISLAAGNTRKRDILRQPF